MSALRTSCQPLGLLLGVILLLHGSAVAAQPLNDSCTAAIDILPGTVFGTTVGATDDGGATCGAASDSPDVWYRFTAPEDVALFVDTCGAGTDYDTVLSLHAACPGDETNEVVCNDDWCGLFSKVSANLVSGETVWVRVAGFGGGSGNFELAAATGEPELSIRDAAEAHGLILESVAGGDEAGYRVALGGDFNGDGSNDMLIGAPSAIGGAGAAYVVFGEWRIGPQIDLATLDGANGLTIEGFDYAGAGWSVSWAGDINADGYSDVLVGAPWTDPLFPNAGGAFVVFGDASPSAVIDLLSLDGSDGFAFYGVDSYAEAGTDVSYAGDVNGDGFDDILIGAPNVDLDTGAAYLVYGHPNFPAEIGPGDLDGTHGVVFEGVSTYDNSGWAVAGAGDINDDGYDDVLIGAPDADPSGRYDSGAVYLVYGAAALGSPFALDGLDGSNGVTIEGVAEGDYAGYSISAAGDVNGDGILDLAIGAIYASSGSGSYTGEAYVVYGGSLDATVELSALTESTGCVLEGQDEYGFAGETIAAGGDVNGDGYDDVVVGEPNHDGPAGYDNGRVYVLHGGAGLPASQALSDFDVVYSGVSAGHRAGQGIAIAGDLNGDAVDDLFVGAPGAGEVYAIFGTTVGRYLVGDWDGDGLDNIAVRRGHEVFMDHDFDGGVDQTQTYGASDGTDHYLVGDWDGDGRDNLAVRRGNVVLMDTDFDGHHDLEFRYGRGDGEDEYLVGDFNGDGWEDFAVRRDNNLLVELWPYEDGQHDEAAIYGTGGAEDQYLVGNWNNDVNPRQTFAVRRGNEIWMNADHDGHHDFIMSFGGGDHEDEYLVGDWDGDGSDEIACRRGYRILMSTDYDGHHDLEQHFGLGYDE